MDSVPLIIAIGFAGFFVGLLLWQQVVNAFLLARGLYDQPRPLDMLAMEKAISVSKRVGAVWVTGFSVSAGWLYLSQVPHARLATLLAGAALVPIVVLPNAIRIAQGRIANDFPLRRFLRRVLQTFLGTLVLCQVIFAIPFSALFIYGSYRLGDLTVSSAMRSIAIASLGAAFFSVWFYMILGGMRPDPRSERKLPPPESRS